MLKDLLIKAIISSFFSFWNTAYSVAQDFTETEVRVKEALSLSVRIVDQDLYLIDKSKYFDDVLSKIKSVYPFGRRIHVYSYASGPPRIFFHEKNFFIVVDEAYMISNAADSRWSEIAAIAHEVGHFVNNDLQVDGDREREELRADKFAGRVLCSLGASGADAVKAFEEILPEESSPGYPEKNERLSFVAAGWAEACRVRCNIDMAMEEFMKCRP